MVVRPLNQKSWNLHFNKRSGFLTKAYYHILNVAISVYCTVIELLAVQKEGTRDPRQRWQKGGNDEGCWVREQRHFFYLTLGEDFMAFKHAGHKNSRGKPNFSLGTNWEKWGRWCWQAISLGNHVWCHRAKDHVSFHKNVLVHQIEGHDINGK